MKASGKSQASAALTLGKSSPIPKEWKEGALETFSKEGREEKSLASKRIRNLDGPGCSLFSITTVSRFRSC